MTSREKWAAGSLKNSIRRRAHHLTRKVIAFLRENKEGYRIRLQRLKGNKELCIKKHSMGTTNILGLTDYESWLIVVDFRYSPLNTIIHEVLHALDSSASEKNIVAREVFVMEHLTEAQATEIWIHAADCMRVT